MTGPRPASGRPMTQIASGTARGRSGSLNTEAAGLQPPEGDVRASDATDRRHGVPFGVFENERGDRLRRTPVVFRVARLAWQSPVLLSVASAFLSIVALAARGASASAALAACNDQTNHPSGDRWGVTLSAKLDGGWR